MSWGKGLYDLVKIQVKTPCGGYYLRWYYNGFHYWYFYPGAISFLSEGEEYRRIGVRRVAMSTGQITTAQAYGIKTLMNTKEVSILTNDGWRSIGIERNSIVIYDNKIGGAEIELIAIVGSRSISYTSGYSPIIVIPAVTTDHVILGALYNRYACTEARQLSSMGWRVPTDADWETLGTYLGATVTGGYFDTPNSVGGRLKEDGTNYWAAPNTGAINDVGFKARAAGYRNGLTGAFSGLNSQGQYHGNYTIGTAAYTNAFIYNSADIDTSFTTMTAGLSVRLVKNITNKSHGQTGTYEGNDGRIYNTICIGTQEWMTENLAETKYGNGDLISIVTDSVTWTGITSGAMCAPNNDWVYL